MWAEMVLIEYNMVLIEYNMVTKYFFLEYPFLGEFTRAISLNLKSLAVKGAIAHGKKS